MKRNILSWLGYIKRMKSDEFLKKVYLSKNVGPNSRGRPLGRWKGRVKKSMCEMGTTRKGGFEQARGIGWTGRGKRLFCCGHSLGECSKRK